MTTESSNAVGFGSLLGFLNTLFIAAGMSVYWHEGIAIAVVVFLFGIIPGLITGRVLGAFAHATSRLDVWLRRLVLALPAVGVLLGMAACFGASGGFLPAVIPTLVCVLILERKTRYVAPVPVAVAV